MKNLLWTAGIISICCFTSCKSVYEKQGDDHLENGDPLKALQRYKYVVQKKSGSKNFNNNLTRAYVGAMEKTVEQGDMDIIKLITFQEKINDLLQTVNAQDIKQSYAKTAVSIAKTLIGQGTFSAEDLAFKLLTDAELQGNLPADLKLQISSIKNSYIKQHMDQAEQHYQSCMNGEDAEGIVADYLMSKVALFIEPTAEMNELWSKIRQANLSTYLIYDLQGLIDNPLPQINRFGVLLAIRTLTRSSNSTTIQVQAYNGSTSLFKFVGDGFKLVDKEGKEYQPVSKVGSFSAQKDVELGKETNVGQLRFNVPGDAELAYLQFESEAGQSIKYLP